MAKTYKVTERVLVDHPDGYQVLAAVPGDEIPHERAVELGLVDADDDVVTAEVRRSRRPRGGVKAARGENSGDAEEPTEEA